MGTVNRVEPRREIVPLVQLHYAAGMPLAEDIVTSRYRFSAYGPDSVTVNETVYRNSLIISANEIIAPWPVTGMSQLSAENLQPLFDFNPEVVLLGSGASQVFPETRIFALFGERGIGLEVMDNGALCRTFNILIAEDRAVIAGVLLGDPD